jgi:hypothetical protein
MIRNRLSPERRLMLAILEDAMLIARSAAARSTRLARETEAWSNDDDRTWLFAFRNVCDALDLDADAVRRQFHAERARTVPAAPQPRAVRALAAGG